MVSIFQTSMEQKIARGRKLKQIIVFAVETSKSSDMELKAKRNRIYYKWINISLR